MSASLGISLVEGPLPSLGREEAGARTAEEEGQVWGGASPAGGQ